MRRNNLLVITLFFLILSVFFAASHTANASDAGRKLFIEKRCYTCHTIKAESKAIQKEKEAFAKSKGIDLSSKKKEEEERIGPDLSDIGSKRDVDSFNKFLKNPKPYFLTTPVCKKKAKKKYRKRFKGSKEEKDTLVSYLAGLKYDSQRASDFESCLKEE